jgi:hypothetical protein
MPCLKGMKRRMPIANAVAIQAPPSTLIKANKRIWKDGSTSAQVLPAAIA